MTEARFDDRSSKTSRGARALRSRIPRCGIRGQACAPGVAASRSPRRTPRFRLAIALAVLAVVALLGLSFEAHAFAREILRDAPSATASPVSGGLLLGERVSLEEARRRMGASLLVPAATELGAPDEVYVAPSGVACFVTQVRGGVDVPIFGKISRPGTRITELTVNGGRGTWLRWRAARHHVSRRAITIRPNRLRPAGNALLWEQAGLAVRVEADVDLESARRLAASMR